MLFNHESAENVELLDPEGTRSFLCFVFGKFHQKSGGLQKVIGFPVELDGLQDLLVVQQMLGVLGQQGGDLGWWKAKLWFNFNQICLKINPWKEIKL